MSNIDNAAPTSTTEGAAEATAVNTPVDATIPDSPASPAASDPVGAAAGAEAAHWAATLGEGMAEKFKDFASAEELAEAAVRGKAYTPATTLEEFDLGYTPTTEEDKKQHESYKRFCLECGVTPQMAKDLAEWNVKTGAELLQAQFEKGQAELRGKWGATYNDKVNGALQTVTTLDKRMGGALSKELARSGGNNNPVIIETLYTLSTLISEATLSGANGGSGEIKSMDTVDFLKQEVFKNNQE